jgi:hypothetical protein
MAYDALGNYVPGDDEPSLDQMRLALTKQPSLASQIPGSSVQAPKPDRPLERAELNFKNIAASLNPLMMMKTAQDVVKTAVINPLLTPASIAVEAAQGKKITGSALSQPPTTPVGQMFEESLAKAMDVAKVPHMGLLARPAGRRPVVTPNDVRVMGAEATRVGRQIGDIPSDFANAQSGLTRMDPVTNQPTYGAKLQGVAEGIGDLAQSRRDAGMSLVPGVPDIFTPETSMYAVRPKGSRLVTPTRTSADPNFTYQFDPTGDVLKREFARPYSTDIEPVELQGIAESTQSKMPNARAAEQAFTNYSNQRMGEMFPDAPDSFQAQEAFRAKYSTPESQAQLQLQLLDDFIAQTPEGQTSGLVRPAELEQRHIAATKWLAGPFSNYIDRNLGTAGDPLVKLASQGFTMRPPEELRAEQVNRIGIAMGQREKGGYPQEGSFQKLLDAKEGELAAARTELRELETRRDELGTAARAQGLEDPAALPEYAALTNPIRAKASARDKLQKELDNLYTGAAYEDISDAAVRVNPASRMQENIDYPQKQFYPTLMQTPAGAPVYGASSNSMSDTGIQDIAKKFYDDVMSGKIPLDKVEKTTVENFVRRKSEERVKNEADKKAREAQYIATAEDNLKAVLQYDVPNSMTFGNAGVILLDQNTPESIAVARVSEDTTVLDHCVGEGGGASSDAINPFTGKQRRYEPIIDLVTGQKNPNASKAVTAYTRGLANGNQLASIRSLETGRPVATLQFETSHLGTNGRQMYRIGYASGVQNGKIDPAYATSIRDYLNSRADDIGGAGENLADNAGVYDTKSSDDLRRLMRKSNLVTADINDALDSLPRFVLAEDVTKAVAGLATPAPTRGAVATTEPAVMTAAESGAVTGDLTIAMSNAVDTLRADYGDRVADGLEGIIRGRMREFLDGVRNEQLPVALGALQRALRQDEMMFVASNSDFNQQLGDGVSEFLIDLDGIVAHNERLLQGRNAVPDILADMFEPEPNHPANLPAPVMPMLDYPGIRDSVLNDLAQNVGTDVAERVETIAARIAEHTNPRLDPAGFVTAVRDAADNQLSEIVERALYDLADQVETAQPAPAQAPANMARRDPINRDISIATTTALEHALAPVDLTAVERLANLLTDVNDREDLPRIVSLVRNNLMGEWEEFDMTQRELLARLVGEHYEHAPPTPVAMPAPDTPEAAQLREDANQIGYLISESHLADAGDEDAALRLLQGYIRDLDTNMLEDLLGMDGDGFDITPQLVEAVRQELEQYLGDYDGYANGGAVRGYRSGGAVKKRKAPSQAFTAQANGDIVNKNPSVEQMRFEIMMRGK